MEEKDLQNINEIDMECSCCDDDDDFVVIKKPTITRSFHKEDEEGSEDRELKSSTGIIIDLSDDDNVPNTPKSKIHTEEPIRTITADITPEGNLSFNGLHNSEPSGFNEIDMETDVIPDDYEGDYDLVNTKKNKRDSFDFGDDEYFEDEEKELVSEDMIEEKKSTTQGAVEKDYWDKLQKKHAKTNVKGSYNNHFHLAGDPKREMELFNHDMGNPSKPVDGKLAGGKGVGSFAADGGSITGFAGSSAASTGGDAAGCCESYKKLFEGLLDITGFELNKGKDGYCLKDTCGMCPDSNCKDMDEVILILTPYIEDSFICPLQVATGENFDNCKDWCNWYTPEMKEKFPKCANDVKYCDLIANHINDCRF